MSVSRFGPMIEDAGRRPALWRLALGFVTTFAVLAGWIAVLIVLRAAWHGTSLADAAADILALGAGTPGQAALYLLAVAGLGLGACVAAALWHGRTPRSLIGPGPKTLRHGVIAAAAAFVFLTFLGLLSLPISDPIEQNQPISQWLTWLPVAVFALVLQTGAEEMFFRGYLQSQLAARFRNPMVAILFPALLFGFLHYVPTFPLIPALTYVLIATMFGILAGDLTMRTGSIGAAWGFHFANNAMAVVIIAPGGTISGLAPWRTGSGFAPETLSPPLATIEIFVLLATWYLLRRILRV